LSPIRQDKILSEKQGPAAYGAKKQGHISQQFQKKGKGVNVGCDYGRRIHPPLQNPLTNQQTDSRGSHSGTGVFLPRGETGAPFEAPKKTGIVSVRRNFGASFVFDSRCCLVTGGGHR